MEFLSNISGPTRDFFNPDRVSTLIRLSLLVVVGLPLVFIIGKWLRVSLSRKLSPQQGMIFSKLVVYSGIAVIAFSVLNEAGFKLSHLLGAAGIFGIAIGFASQTSVSNIISGVFLMVEKSFEVGDVITVGTQTGTVMSIDMLSVKLRTLDNKFVRLPNESVIKSEVINITRFPIRRIDLTIGVAYKEDVKRVREILMEVARKNPLCLYEPEPLILTSEFGASSINLLLLVWAIKSDNLTTLTLKSTMLEEIKIRFDAEGIEFPYPHVSLYTGEITKPFPVELVDKSRV